MWPNRLLHRIGLADSWSRELTAAGASLACGAALMPVLIYYAGVFTLGRYEGASLGQIYRIVFDGLKQPSLASWTVFLGPYGLLLIYRGLRTWWRAGSVQP